MIRTKETLVRQSLANQVIEHAYEKLLALLEQSEKDRIASDGPAPDPSTAVEIPLVGSKRIVGSDAQKIHLRPTLYKRYHPKNPPLPSPESKFRVAGTIMMKDEAPYIQKTIESFAPFVNCFVVLDTGSTDDSIELARAAANNWNTPIFVMETSWIKFGDSRNHVLDFAEKIAEFALLLDVSDEARNGENLKEILDRWDDKKQGYQMPVQCNAFMHSMMRLTKTAWQMRFKYPVHEVLQSGGGETLERLPADKFHLYQDRNTAKPSTERFKRDALDLLAYHLNDKSDTRVVFYLAQSLKDSGNLHCAYRFYQLRSTMMEGWYEERYMSHIHCANLASQVGFDESVVEDHYKNAFQTIASPLCAFDLYMHYMRYNKIHLAYAWIITACTLPDPRLSLHNDNFHMGHKRWACYGSLAGCLGHFKPAIEAYKRAQDEILFGEYDLRVRLANDPKAKTPPEDSNASWFTFAYEKYSRAKEHPEWFANVPTSYLTADLAEKLGRKQ
jgi:glycosyltransferase involved in cell wall biosynthesis